MPLCGTKKSKKMKRDPSPPYPTRASVVDLARANKKVKALQDENSQLDKELKEEKNQKRLLLEQIQSLEKRLKENVEVNKDKTDTVISIPETSGEEIKDYQKQLKDMQRQIEEEHTKRLSAATATRVFDGNPNVSELRDQNRPQRLAEQMGQLYDDQWTDASEALDAFETNENTIIKTLLDLVTTVYGHCKEFAENQLSRIEEDIFLPPMESQAPALNPDLNGTETVKSPTSSKHSMSKRKGEKLPEIPAEVRKSVNEYRKRITKQVTPFIEKEIMNKLRENPEFGDKIVDACNKYISRCVELCWLMRVQDPPVALSWSIPEDRSFDSDVYRAYTKSGTHIEFMVWPTMYLYEGGPVLMKGVAQGIKEVKESNRLSAATATRVIDGNPNVSELSDQNRPQKLGEQMGQLYDDQWTDASEALDAFETNENIIIKTLLDLMTTVYGHCKEFAENQLSRIEEDIFLPPIESQAPALNPDLNGTETVKSPTSSKHSMSKMKGEKMPEIPAEVRQGVREYRKRITKQVTPFIEKEIMNKLRENPEFGDKIVDACNKYISRCVELCWLMRVQYPPVALSWSIPEDRSFDSDVYRAYTKSGTHIEFMVWPTMYLYEGGPVLMKGVAQGINEVKESNRLSAATATRVIDGNPNVSELSDQNRPQKLGERMGQLYDDIWTDASEALDAFETNENTIIKTLLDLMTTVYGHCKESSENQLSRIEEDIFLPPMESQAPALSPDLNGTEPIKSPTSSKHSMSRIPRFTSHKGRPALPNMSSEKKTTDTESNDKEKHKSKRSLSFHRMKGEKLPEIPAEVRKGVKEYRKRITKQVTPFIEKNIMNKLRENPEFGDKIVDDCNKYISRCVELCWLMRVQDPPVALSWSIPEDRSFDSDVYRAYTKSGTHIEFMVWPTVYLYEGGPVLMKGVAQGIND